MCVVSMHPCWRLAISDMHAAPCPPEEKPPEQEPPCPAALEVDTEEPSALHDAIVWPHGTEPQPSFADLSPGSPRRTALKLGHSRAFILVDLVLSSGR